MYIDIHVTKLVHGISKVMCHEHEMETNGYNLCYKATPMSYYNTTHFLFYLVHKC